MDSDRRKYFYGVIAALCLAAVVRIWGLGARSLWVDEALTMLRAHKGPGWLIGLKFPVSYGLFWFWRLIVGGAGFAYWRLFSVLWSLVVLALTMALARDLFDRETAAWAGILMAIAAYFIDLAQFIRYPSMLMVFCLGAVYCLWRWSREEKARFLILHVVFICLALGTHAYALLLLPAFAIYVLLDLRKDRFLLSQWLLAEAFLLVLFLIIAVQNKIFSSATGTGASHFGFLPLADIIAHLKTLPIFTIPHIMVEFVLGRHWVPLYPLWLLVSTSIIVGTAIIMAGVKLLRCKAEDRFLWIMLMTPLFLSWVLMIVYGLWARAQYLCIVAPLFFILVARGLGGYGAVFFKRVIGAALIAVLCFSLWTYCRYPGTVRSSEDAAEFISEHIQPGEIIVAINSWEKYLFEVLMPTQDSFVFYNTQINLRKRTKSSERHMQSVADAEEFVLGFPLNAGVWVIYARNVPRWEDLGEVKEDGQRVGFLDQAMEKHYRIDDKINRFGYEPIWYAGEIAYVVHYLPEDGSESSLPSRFGQQ